MNSYIIILSYFSLLLESNNTLIYPGKMVKITKRVGAYTNRGWDVDVTDLKVCV